MPRRARGSRLGIGTALCVCLVLAASCAVVEPPPGGPVDITPPRLTVMSPDSGATGVGEIKTFNLTFSEKMDRVSAATWLHFFPDQRIRQTKWHGATEAEVILEFPLPPDTVIVVEVASGVRDAHKVAATESRRFPIATGGLIPSGSISGVLLMADSAVTRGVVELYDIPPDTLEYFQQPLLRRTVTDLTGTFRFDWLPVPGGPWLMRAFTDPDDNLRPGEKDAQRLIPDTLSLTLEEPEATAGVTTLFAWNTPGRILLNPFASPDTLAPMRAWTLAIAEEDTGWVPAPEDGTRHPISDLDPERISTVTEVVPGNTRLIMFADLDRDSTFSAVPDSLVLSLLPDSLASALTDTITEWFLEPWFMVDGIEVDPGLDTAFTVPVPTLSFTPWTAPPPATAAPDSSQAVPEESP